MGQMTYVLVTPARNEEAFIEHTLQSVVAQTMVPRKWVIISDGSTDRTDEIVSSYATAHDFIQLVQIRRKEKRNFAAKVRAINVGFEQLQGIEYEFCGNLDADVSFAPDYFARVLGKFAQNPKLGVAGGGIFEYHNGKQESRFGNLESHVAGAVQLFRRSCYEAIGGYLPLKYGGEDTVIIEMARMRGWEVRSYPEIQVIHHRKTGAGGGSIYRGRFWQGREDYFLGDHPVYFTGKCASRVMERPYLVGSLLRFGGYWWSWCQRGRREIPADVIQYIRRGQMHRLVSLFSIVGRVRLWKKKERELTDNG